MNSLTLDMIETVYTLIDPLKTFVLTGDKKVFSVGDDSLWMYSNPRNIETYCKLKAKCEIKLKDADAVCVIRGSCLGTAAGLSLACKYRIATSSSLIGLPENSLGSTPDCSMLHYLSNNCGGLGLYLCLTGYCLKGPDLLLKGIATHFIQDNHIDKFLEDCKSSTDLQSLCDKYNTVPQTSSKIHKNLDEIEEIFGKINNIEDLYEKLANKETEFRKSVLHLLAQQCPLSLKVFYRQISLKSFFKCRSKSYRQCIEMGYNLNVQTLHVNNFNFVSAVYTKLIQKSKLVPQWQPDHVTSITTSLVNSYFTSLDIPD